MALSIRHEHHCENGETMNLLCESGLAMLFNLSLFVDFGGTSYFSQTPLEREREKE